MDLRRRFCKCEGWHLHRANLFLLVLTLGLFIGIDILDRGSKIDVWTNIPFSIITNSNFIKGMPIDQLVFAYLLLLMNFWAITLTLRFKLRFKPLMKVPLLLVIYCEDLNEFK